MHVMKSLKVNENLNQEKNILIKLGGQLTKYN